jgi:Uma2 family endonuclease
VEVLSPGNSKKEMDNKFRLYEESGVREYWMIEPEDECVFIYVLKDGKYIGLAPAVKIAQSSIFPELKVDLETVF